MGRLSSTILAGLVLATMAGCVSPDICPDHRAERERVESGRCPAIDGEYRNAGEVFPRTGSGIAPRQTSLAPATAAAMQP